MGLFKKDRIAKKDAEEIVKHYGDSESTGAHDSLVIGADSEGQPITLGDCRKIVKPAKD